MAMNVSRNSGGPVASIDVTPMADMPYPEVEKVIDVCRQAGAEQIALLADKKIEG